MVPSPFVGISLNCTGSLPSCPSGAVNVSSEVLTCRHQQSDEADK